MSKLAPPGSGEAEASVGTDLQVKVMTDSSRSIPDDTNTACKLDSPLIAHLQGEDPVGSNYIYQVLNSVFRPMNSLGQWAQQHAVIPTAEAKGSSVKALTSRKYTTGPDRAYVAAAIRARSELVEQDKECQAMKVRTVAGFASISEFTMLVKHTTKPRPALPENQERATVQEAHERSSRIRLVPMKAKPDASIRELKYNTAKEKKHGVDPQRTSIRRTKNGSRFKSRMSEHSTVRGTYCKPMTTGQAVETEQREHFFRKTLEWTNTKTRADADKVDTQSKATNDGSLSKKSRARAPYLLNIVTPQSVAVPRIRTVAQPPFPFPIRHTFESRDKHDQRKGDFETQVHSNQPRLGVRESETPVDATSRTGDDHWELLQGIMGDGSTRAHPMLTCYDGALPGVDLLELENDVLAFSKGAAHEPSPGPDSPADPCKP